MAVVDSSLPPVTPANPAPLANAESVRTQTPSSPLGDTWKRLLRRRSAIIGMVVLLVVLAYVAAGLSLMVGTAARPSSTTDRLLGIAALLACALLIVSSPVKMIVGSVACGVVAWVLFRVFARRE